MKKYLVLVALLFVTPGFAADLYGRRPPNYAPPGVAEPLFNWTGFYLGAHGGYGWGDALGINPRGYVVGGQAGYNYQLASGLVFGIEGDISVTGIDRTAGGVNFGMDYIGTIRPRIGFGVDRVLLYGTGGAAFGRGDLTIGGLSNKQVQWGWTLGGGLEAMIAPNLSARFEYLYVDLGNETYASIVGPVNVGFTSNILRAGVNYKF
jgi:outer membrane immunogenic protein